VYDKSSSVWLALDPPCLISPEINPQQQIASIHFLIVLNQQAHELPATCGAMGVASPAMKASPVDSNKAINRC